MDLIQNCLSVPRTMNKIKVAMKNTTKYYYTGALNFTTNQVMFCVVLEKVLKPHSKNDIMSGCLVPQKQVN